MDSVSVESSSSSRSRDQNSQDLLDRKKLHLVLDLDNTLIDSILSGNPQTAKHKDVYPISKGDMLLKLRPRVGYFLRKASHLFDLSIYTKSREPYAREIAKILEERGSVRFTRVISRDERTRTTKYRKTLDRVLYDRRMVLIVDDSTKVWGVEDKLNLVIIKPYYFHNDDSKDEELVRVLGILKDVHAKFYEADNSNNYDDDDKDVRDLLKRRLILIDT